MLAVAYLPAFSETPEANFAGVWRIIDAKPAPWIKPFALTKDKAPLLEYAVLFGDGEVIGPAPLGCKPAKFSTVIAGPEGLFQGRLPKSDAPTIANAMGIQTTTFRVACPGGSFDYHLDSNGGLLIALNDVVYTLRRPEGDVSKVTPGYSGPSFDCVKAKSAGEKTICLDAGLSRYDLAIANAYERLEKSLTSESFATVQTAQRAWLAYVLKACGANMPIPEDQGARSDIKSCLEENYSDRSERLSGVAVVESGTLRLEPRTRFFSKPKPKTEDSDIYPWMAGGPQAKAFNDYVEKKLKLSKRRMDDKELFAFGDDIPDNQSLYARRTYSVLRFDERIASLQVLTYDYTGGAHEVLGEASLNWDMAKARPFQASELFDPGKPWRKFVSDFCVTELEAQSSGEGPARSAVEAVVAGNENWLFAKANARVHFPVYSIASFSGGEFDVDIPYSKLKPYLKADALGLLGGQN